MRFAEQPSPTGFFCRKCISHGAPISGSHRGLCPYAACSCCICTITKSQRIAMRKMKRQQGWKVRCPIDQLIPTICSSTVIYSSTPVLRTSPKVESQNMAEVLSSLAANTVVSSKEKGVDKNRSSMTLPTPLQLLQNGSHSAPTEPIKAPALDLHRSAKTSDIEKAYLNCLERNPLVHGYTNLISALYDLYEKQAIASQKWSSRQEPLRNDVEYQSFLEQVRSKEKEIMYGAAKVYG
uniref:DM domain-containing protein n=1 Tax=Plectus sambesii TaxID=2011161 RepID=A0A914WSU8_9BILA